MPVQRSLWKRSSRPLLEADTGPGSSMPRAQVPGPPESAQQGLKRSRIGDTWVGITVGAIMLVLLIIFILQNTVLVNVAFLGLHGSAPLAVMLLIAGAGFAIVTLIVGSLRIGQLRRRISRGRPPSATT